jgi:hypothetical protein
MYKIIKFNISGDMMVVGRNLTEEKANEIVAKFNKKSGWVEHYQVFKML